MGRNINKAGTMMLGDGFNITETMLKNLNLTESSLIDLIENIVVGLKGKSEYTNLKFVENIGKKYHMNESHIMEMKNIIWASPTKSSAHRLYEYITECACQQAQSQFGDYDMQAQDASSMIPQIKQSFNKNRGQMPVTQAIQATAKGVGVPMEMVEEMYEAQKASHKMKLEGMDSNGVNEQLEEIYEKYQNMSEGDMYGMYDEMAEMMDYPTSDSAEMAEISVEDEYPIDNDSNVGMIDLAEEEFESSKNYNDGIGDVEPEGFDDMDTEFDMPMGGLDEMMTENPINFEDDIHTEFPEDAPETMMDVLNKVSFDPHGEEAQALAQEDPFFGADDPDYEREKAAGLWDEEVSDKRFINASDDPLEDVDVFNEVMREMEDFVSEDNDQEMNFEPITPTDENSLEYPNNNKVETANGIVYTIDFAPDNVGFHITSDMGGEPIYATVENGEIITDTEIDEQVRVAILSMYNSNNEAEAEYMNPSGEFPIDESFLAELDVVEDTEEITEVKSALDNITLELKQ